MTGSLPFPVKNPLLPVQVEQYCYRFQDVRPSEPSLHYELVLPHEWRLVDGPAASAVPEAPAPLARIRATAGPEAELTVTAVHLSREMTPADWLDLFLEAQREPVVHRRTVETPGGPVADVLTRREDPDGVSVSRWIAFKDHDRLFLLQAHCPEAHYRTHALAFFMALTSFHLLHPVGWPLAESLNAFSRRVPGDYCLFYPASWTLKEDGDSTDEAREVHFFNRVGARTRGTMRVTTLARALVDRPQRLVDAVAAQLGAEGSVPPALELAPVAPFGGFRAAWQGRVEVSGPDGTTEARVTIGERPDAWFVLVLLTPPRVADAAVWAVNRRAYDLLLEHLRTPLAYHAAAA